MSEDAVEVSVGNLDMKNPNEVVFAGFWSKMLARYGGGITEAEFDKLTMDRLDAKIGKKQ